MTDYDVVIVGGGSAGCVLAARLSEDSGTKVLLLEAGPDYPTVADLPDEIRNGNNLWDCVQGPHSWNYLAWTNGPGSRLIKIPRGRLVGGSSAINGQAVYRGLPEDFDAWAAQGNPGWSYEDVLPYFIKLESDHDFVSDYHGQAGPLPVRRYFRKDWLPHSRAFVDACLRAGFAADPDANAPTGEGVGPRALNNVDGMRISAAVAYLGPARSRPNLTVLGDRLAHRVLVDGGRAIGVEAGLDRAVYRGREIIVCAGAVASPQLLLLSGIGPRAELEECDIPVVLDLPGVGRNLRDHPALFLLFRARQMPTDPQAPPLQVGLRYSTPGSPYRAELQMSPILMSSEHRPQDVRVDDVGNFFGITVSLQNAMTAGTLKLQSADPRYSPQLDYNYLTDPFDRERMRHAVRLAADIAADRAYADIVVNRIFPTDEQLLDDDRLDKWMAENVKTQHHSSGTCKMGPAEDPLAVVDAAGRVHGLERLRVVDGSIMPDVVRSNTQVTILMMAEKLADAIKVDLRSVTQ